MKVKRVINEPEIENWKDLPADLKKSIQRGLLQSKKVS